MSLGSRREFTARHIPGLGERSTHAKRQHARYARSASRTWIMAEDPEVLQLFIV